MTLNDKKSWLSVYFYSEAVKQYFIVFVFILGLLKIPDLSAQIPGVLLTGVSVKQDPQTKIVEISYDLVSELPVSLMISVQVSADSGNSYTVPVNFVSGDIGKGVTAGLQKKIYWDALADFRGMLEYDSRIKIIAETYIKDFDGMTLVPGGEFVMGSDSTAGNPDEFPKGTVYLDSYFIDKFEVTNSKFSEFLNVNPRYYTYGMKIRPDQGTYNAESGFELHPVTCLPFASASAYADWAGKRLPTEAEWEKAARGGLYLDGDNMKMVTNFLSERVYPWGNSITYEYCNYYNENNAFSGTSPVGFYDGQDHDGIATHNNQSSYGIYDMAGNAWEWTQDWYKADYYVSRPYRNPRGPSDGVEKVIRGGSWNTGEDYVRVSSRMKTAPANESSQIGFRCVKEVGTVVYGGEIMPDENTLGLWHCNETRSTALKDQMMRNDGSVPDTLRTTFGYRNRGLVFTGIGKVAQIPIDDNVDFSGSFTLEFWLRKDSLSENSVEVVMKKAGLQDEKYPFCFYFSPSDSGKISCESVSSTGKIDLKGKADFLDRSWRHVALVRNVSENNTTLYINGQKEDVGDLPVDVGNQVSIYIGGESDGSKSFSGYLDEIRISAGARTQEEILEYLLTRQSIILSDIFTLDTRDPAGVMNDGKIVTGFHIKQSYPNPFNSSTTIEFMLPVDTQVKLEIFNVRGQWIETLKNEFMPKGTKRVIWNAGYYSSGVYFIRIKAGAYTKTIKALYIK